MEKRFLATYQIPGQAEVVMELKKKVRNWCWYKKGEIIGRSRDEYQGSFGPPGSNLLDFRSWSSFIERNKSSRAEKKCIGLPV